MDQEKKHLKSLLKEKKLKLNVIKKLMEVVGLVS